MRVQRIAVHFAAVLGALAGAASAVAAAQRPAVPLSAPAGITFQDVTNSGSGFLWRYFATTSAKPLYTYDADGDKGRRTCVGACAQEFSPYPAPHGAIATGDWSLLPLAGDQKQWAFRARPLYVFNGKDPAPNTFRYYADKDKAAVVDPRMYDPGSALFSPKQGWRRAAFMPDQLTVVPSGITLKSLALANGYGLADASSGLLLYVLPTPPKNPRAWTPLYAPDLAEAVGDFSILLRKDGKRQWAYRHQALFSFTGDYSSDELTGMKLQSDAQPALVYRNFMPSHVRIKFVRFRGPLMVTDQGLSLYTQSRDRSAKISYKEAVAVGTHGCVGECLKMWKPFLVGPHDVGSGFFEIEQRPDGTRQWSYKGGALYTYVGDKHLGDVEGSNREVIVYGDPKGDNYDLVSLAGGNRGPDFRPYAGAGFHWHLIAFYD